MHKEKLSINRLVGLTDGAYAILLTFLFLPLLEHITAAIASLKGSHELDVFLGELLELFIIYLGGFVVVGKYWMLHHEMFRFIKKSDIKLLWLNLFAFFFVSILPIDMLLLGSKMSWVGQGLFAAATGQGKIFYVILSSTICMAGLFLFWMWNYAAKKPGLVEENLGQRRIMSVKLNIILIPVIFFLSNIFVLFLSELLGWTWLLIFIIPPILNRIYPIEKE
jgi:uncharacterized membrane protein